MASPRTPGYRLSSILLHWLAAAVIVALFILAKNAGAAPDPASRRALMSVHISIGAIAAALIALRLGWRFVVRDGAADPRPGAGGWTDMLATAVKHLLYLVMLVLIITGPLTVWAAGRPIDIFGLVALPSPFGRLESHDILGLVHGIATKALLPLVALHILGAFKHLVLDRDGVFQRMLVPRR